MTLLAKRSLAAPRRGANPAPGPQSAGWTLLLISILFAAIALAAAHFLPDRALHRLERQIVSPSAASASEPGNVPAAAH